MVGAPLWMDGAGKRVLSLLGFERRCRSQRLMGN
jgi:hypothetical protein